MRLTKYNVILKEFTLTNLKRGDMNDLISVCINTSITPVTYFKRGIVLNVLDQIYIKEGQSFSKSQTVNSLTIRTVDFESGIMGTSFYLSAVNSQGQTLYDVGIICVLAFQEVTT